jgi:hypothetical protein
MELVKAEKESIAPWRRVSKLYTESSRTGFPGYGKPSKLLQGRYPDTAQ